MINFLERVLIDNDLFQSILDANDCRQAIKEIDPDIDIDRLFSPVQELSPAKKWEIFSRIRFEYVRPTCTLRTLENPQYRVLPSMEKGEKEYGLRSYFLSGMNVDKDIKEKFSEIGKMPEGSLGFALYNYYRDNNLPPLDKPSLFPPSYIICHDVHHILLNSPVTQQGEVEVIAFESGCLYGNCFPVILLEQLEVFLSDKAPFKTHILARAWKIGSESVPILSHDQVLPLLEKKVEDVRKITNVTPLY